MKIIIEGFQIPDSPEQLAGLKSCSVSKLSEVTVFTGPNGGGKSRLLKLITSQATNHSHINNLRTGLTATRSHLKELQGNFHPASRAQIPHTEQQIENFERELAGLAHFDLAQSASNDVSMLYFSPNISEFSDPNNLTYGATIAYLREGGKIRNISGNFTSSLLTIQSLVSNYLISRSAESEFSADEANDLKRKFKSLEDLIQALLSMNIQWKAGPTITIGGIPLHSINQHFSQGQKWLLHFATSAYSDITINDPIILCLDEPELHLHPAALNQVIDSLRRTLSNGQIFIATHSIPLIAHVGYENTWYVSAGEVTYAGRNPERVINGLLGGKDGVEKLSHLLAEPDLAAISKFALESLLPSDVATASYGDPQAKQILGSLRAKREEAGRALRILDFGAGQRANYRYSSI